MDCITGPTACTHLFKHGTKFFLSSEWGGVLKKVLSHDLYSKSVLFSSNACVFFESSSSVGISGSLRLSVSQILFKILLLSSIPTLSIAHRYTREQMRGARSSNQLRIVINNGDAQMQEKLTFFDEKRVQTLKRYFSCLILTVRNLVKKKGNIFKSCKHVRVIIRVNVKLVRYVYIKFEAGRLVLKVT
jgi:hypothetical protein